MKRKDELIIFQSGGIIDKVSSDKLLKKVDDDTKYILIPDYDSKSYLLVSPSKYLSLKYAKISYILKGYIYADPELNDLYDDMRSDTVLKEVEMEVTDFEMFYNVIWNIIRLRMGGEILAGDFSNADNIMGFIIQHLKIDVEFNNGEVPVYFEWFPYGNISFTSEMVKLASDIAKKFYIPHKEFRYKDKCFLIKSNRWSIELLDMIEDDNAFIGFISDITVQVYFDDFATIVHTMRSHVDIIAYAFHYPSLEEEYPDIRKKICDRKYVDALDLDSAVPTYHFNNGIHIQNDRMTFFMNIHYFFRYMEGLAADANHASLDDVISFIQLTKETRTESEYQSSVNYISTILNKYIV